MRLPLALCNRAHLRATGIRSRVSEFTKRIASWTAQHNQCDPFLSLEVQESIQGRQNVVNRLSCEQTKALLDAAIAAQGLSRIFFWEGRCRSADNSSPA